MKLLPKRPPKTRNSAVRRSERVPLSYYRSKRPTSSERSPFEKVQKSRAKKHFLVALVDVLVLVLIIFVIVYSLIIRADPHLDVSDSSYHSVSVYKSAATDQFKALKNRNKLTLDEKGIVRALQNQFPEIAAASVELPLFGETPTVHLNIASPSFILINDASDYIVDEQGIVVAKKTTLPSIGKLPTVIDQSGFSAMVGKQVLSGSGVTFINSIISQCKHAKVPIRSLTLPPLAQELDLDTADRAYFVKFYLGGDGLTQIGQFLAARHKFDTTNNQPSQYLDVRISGKIFYK